MKIKSSIHRSVRRDLAADVPSWKERARVRQMQDDASALAVFTGFIIFTTHPEWQRLRQNQTHAALLHHLGFNPHAAGRMQHFDRIERRKRRLRK